MATEVKTELAAIIAADLNFTSTRVYNSTQDALDNLDKLIFADYAVALGDMSETIEIDRPKGFTKRRVQLEVLLFTKVATASTGLEEYQQALADLCESAGIGRFPAVTNAVRSYLLSWTPLVKFNNNVYYTIGTVELLLFI